AKGATVTGMLSPGLDARFRAAAAAEGLLAVASDVLDDTPIGSLLVGVTDHGVCRIAFDPEPERELELLARLYGPRVLRASRPVERLRLELDEYFEGRRRHFDVEPDVRVKPEFNRRVPAELAQVEYGSTTTYGALAAQVGHARAARAAGSAASFTSRAYSFVESTTSTPQASTRRAARSTTSWPRSSSSPRGGRRRSTARIRATSSS